MASRKGYGDIVKPLLQISEEEKAKTQTKLTELCECDEVLSADEIAAFERIAEHVVTAKDYISSNDELDEDLKAEYLKLTHILDLPKDTHSLTKITANLPMCVQYGVRSGSTHMHMAQYSPLSRGHQVKLLNIVIFK